MNDLVIGIGLGVLLVTSARFIAEKIFERLSDIKIDELNKTKY